MLLQFLAQFDHLFQAHNAEAIYTALLLMAATGHRPVTDPFCARDAIDTEVAAIEAEQRAERDRREAEVAEFRRGELPRYGDPVYWGWGSGP